MEPNRPKIHMIIVSHGHGKIVAQNRGMRDFIADPDTQVYLVDNLGEQRLRSLCLNTGMRYFHDGRRRGFGANNNYVLANIENENQINLDDYVLFFNPDVVMEIEEYRRLKQQLHRSKENLFTVSLFNDFQYKEFDENVRSFPTLYTFASRFLGFSKDSCAPCPDPYQRTMTIDWCAGSFLGCSYNIYRQLGGFDENFFMYCEDTDFCFRAKYLLGKSVTWYSSFKAVHLARRESRSILSNHFFWHTSSAIRFLLKSKKIKKSIRLNS